LHRNTQFKGTARSGPMPRTIQCTHCSVILNIPGGAKAGKRLRCPRCGFRFAISESEASSASTYPALDDAKPMSGFDIDKRPGTPEELPIPTAEGDLRETFDLPLVRGSGREAERGEVVSGPETADAAGLFRDSGPHKRKPTAAEARARARRCVHCGGVVPQGMSICATCGTDQETGLRVGLEDDLAPPPRPPSPGPPIHVATIGGVLATASLIFLILAIIQSTRSQSALGLPGWLAVALVPAFAIYASVEFIRGRSAKLLIVALTLGVVVDVMLLVAGPILEVVTQDQAEIVTTVRPQGTDDTNTGIKPMEERLDTRRITVGIGLIVLYAIVSLYLISPPVKRYLAMGIRE
jgi:phage FluMu protein Com